MSAAYRKDCDGVARDVIEDRLTAAEYAIECLRKHNRDLVDFNRYANENLSATQARCTALLLEVRDYRRVVAADRHLARSLADVVWERQRQDDKFGAVGTTHKQDAMVIPFGTGDAEQQYAAGHYRTECDDAFASGEGTWAHVLREEVAEALAESDPVALRSELIQLAAVCVKWCEIIDWRNTK